MLTYGPRAAAAMPLGKLVVGPEWTQFALEFNRGEIRDIRALFMVHGSHLLYQLNGDKARQGERVAPEVRDLVDSLEPPERPAVTWAHTGGRSGGLEIENQHLDVRILDPSGRFVGVASVYKPAPGMSQLAAVAATATLGHFERMRLVERPDRRPAAILIADLELSAPLAKRLSTAQFFAFGRRLVRAAANASSINGASSAATPATGLQRSSWPRRAAQSQWLPAHVSQHHDHYETRCHKWLLAATSTRSMFPCASDCTGARRCMSGESSRPDAVRSRRSATKSTRPHGSKSAPLAPDRWLRSR